MATTPVTPNFAKALGRLEGAVKNAIILNKQKNSFEVDRVLREALAESETTCPVYKSNVTY